jgi:hypothetical protein
VFHFHHDQLVEILYCLISGNAGAAHGLAQEGINQGLSSDNTKQFNFEKTVSTLLYRSRSVQNVWYDLQIVFLHLTHSYMSMAL